MTLNTSKSLIGRIKDNTDQQSWERFVKLYSPLLLFWSRKTGLGESEAADAVQEVFIILADKLPTFSYDSSKSFRGWLRRITINKSIDLLRKVNRDPELAESGELRNAFVEDNVAVLSEQEYKSFLLRRALEIMKSEFDESKWKACWMTTVEGKKAEVVANELGITVNSVYLARSRILRRLREELVGLIESGD